VAYLLVIALLSLFIVVNTAVFWQRDSANKKCVKTWQLKIPVTQVLFSHQQFLHLWDKPLRGLGPVL
jgi:hypothetical protein